MAKKWLHPTNTGWTGVDYDFGLPPPERAALSVILNEACHVFYFHSGIGNWNTRPDGKEKYAALIADHIKAHPALRHRLLQSGDRVIKMLTYRAMEILGHNADD